MNKQNQILLVSDRLSTPGNQALIQALASLGDVGLTEENNLIQALHEHPYKLLILDASFLHVRPDVLILDVKEQFPELHIVLLTVSPHWRVAKAVLLAGAEYIEKSQDPTILGERFSAVIEAIHDQHSFFSGDLE